jgi:hypothetical protein
MTRPAIIPVGCWPRRMGADLAAGQVGKSASEAFLICVGPVRPSGERVTRATHGTRRAEAVKALRRCGLLSGWVGRHST